MTVDQEQLRQWVIGQLEQKVDKVDSGVVCSDELTLISLTGDAGFRQYYRLSTHPSLLAVMAPQTDGVSESAAHFALLSKVLRQYGVPTPMVYACDEARNYLLLEYFGDFALLDRLSASSADTLYAESLMVLLTLQEIPEGACRAWVKPYSANLLNDEMALFLQWFVTDLLSYRVNAEERECIVSAFSFLTQQALEQPQVLVHRDYHSRNLIYREGLPPGLIDFQDAVYGPVTYDLVSLLRDCYVRWPLEKVHKWALSYGNMAHEMGIVGTVSERQFLQWFDLMGLQRHIKVLGVFARLSLRDGKDHYLKDLPLVIRYVLEVSRQYRETQAFAQWFEQILLPLAHEQVWYTPYAIAGETE